MAESHMMELPSTKGLQTNEQMQLLDVVDSLRAQGLSEFTALPQLIVCGDQSSGKSSVLEAISGVPFPKQDNLCTRFATEVILRRATADGISVSIVPAKDRCGPELTELLRFQHVLETRDDFPDLFEKAKVAMGLSGSAKAFSRDILRVEIRGPTQPQLTLVDLPGLIHTATNSQTAQDVELVKQLVTEYMTYSRSIILAVVSAKNDVGNQVVLERARELDPRGLRTLGIITKPDTLPRDSASERAFLSLARNEDVKFQLGWHVVKNIDSATKDREAEDRDEQESLFFMETDFRTLPSHSTGITALRTRLSKVLFNQIRAELPRLLKDIESKVSLYESEVHRMGAGRATTDQQRAFLIELSQSFQTICRDGIRGDYDHAFFQDDMESEKRLCAVLMNMHFSFAEELRTDGAKWIVTDSKDDSNEKSRTREEAVKDACELLKRSRGRELPGLPNPRLVGELFREYSSPWKGLAAQHIKNVWNATTRFLELVLQHLTNTDVADAVLGLWLYPIMEERLVAAYEKLDELTNVHKEDPMTTNHYFLDNVKKMQQKTAKEDCEERLKKEFASGRQLTVNDIASILSTIGPRTNTDMDKVAAEDAFDNMNAYYKVAMKLFMDNVPSLAIQAPIILKVPSMLSPKSVFSMESELVARIAGESEEKILNREDIQRKLATLRTGARICKQYATRRQSSINQRPQHQINHDDHKTTSGGQEKLVSDSTPSHVAAPYEPPLTGKPSPFGKPDESTKGVFGPWAPKQETSANSVGSGFGNLASAPFGAPSILSAQNPPKSSTPNGFKFSDSLFPATSEYLGKTSSPSGSSIIASGPSQPLFGKKDTTTGQPGAKQQPQNGKV